jgi:hypothetical protein
MRRADKEPRTGKNKESRQGWGELERRQGQARRQAQTKNKSRHEGHEKQE